VYMCVRVYRLQVFRVCAAQHRALQGMCVKDTCVYKRIRRRTSVYMCIRVYTCVIHVCTRAYVYRLQVSRVCAAQHRALWGVCEREHAKESISISVYTCVYVRTRAHAYSLHSCIQSSSPPSLRNPKSSVLRYVSERQRARDRV